MLLALTARDAWCYSPNKKSVSKNMKSMIDFYGQELARFNMAFANTDKKIKDTKVDSFINSDAKKISWSRALKQSLARDKRFVFMPTGITQSLYRPFTKQWLYFNRHFNEMIYQMPRIFPDAKVGNLVICVSGTGARSGFSSILANTLPNYDTVEKGQCFPLYLYDSPDADSDAKPNLFGAATQSRRDAITDEDVGAITVLNEAELALHVGKLTLHPRDLVLVKAL